MLRSLLVFSLAIAVVWTQSKEKNYISSLADKMELLDLNEKLFLNLNKYIDNLQEKTDTLIRLSQQIQQPLRAAKGREEEFLSNPLNCFSLIRFTHLGWLQMARIMDQPVGQEQIDFIREMQPKFPLVQDFEEAARAIDRIQQTYALKPSDMANGFLDGVQYDAKLTSLDCYHVGYFLFLANQFAEASMWLITARNLMDPTQTEMGISRRDVTSLLVESFIELGYLKLARLALITESKLNFKDDHLMEVYKSHTPKNGNKMEMTLGEDQYTQLCQSSNKPKTKPKPNRLSCSYKKGPGHFLRLAPFRVEELHKDPDIVVFHNVIYESEIAKLKRFSQPLLVRTKIKLFDKDEERVSLKRTSSGIWLPHQNLTQLDNQVVLRIQQRITDMTDLLLIRALQQYMDYGFGGHCSPHCDYINVGKIHRLFDDRIATVLFYLNNVAKGGATVFPHLDLVVEPERGKALFWYNMVPGTYDYDDRTLHGACPVIIGNKLALTQWINEQDQMFIKPCLQPPVNRKYYINTTESRS